jgi:APA family basic amino acid/polyamine antiporter
MARLAPILLIAAVAAINVKGTDESASVQGWTTLFKAGMVVAMSGALIYYGSGNSITAAPIWPETLSGSLLSGIGLAMIGTLWAYEGWQYVTFSAGETRNPQRTFPAGIVVGTVVLILIYLFANIGYIVALGPEAAAASDTIAADATGAILGPLAGKLIAATIVISMFSAANGLTLTAPRVFFAMARDGLFFRRLAEVHPRFGTPAFAVTAGSMWAMLLAATGTFEQLLTYVVFSGWIFYALGAASIFIYRRRQPHLPRPFRVPGYPVTPALFVVAAVAIVINTLVAQPERAIVGAGIVFLGTPAYFFWKRRGQKSAVGASSGADSEADQDQSEHA